MYHCFSLEFHFRNANVLGSDSPWFISLFIFAHICLCPCVCLLLIPPFFQPACLLWDRGLPHMPPSGPHTCLCTCVRAHMHTESGTNQLGSLLPCFIQPSPCYCKLLGSNNPVCSRLCTRVSALRALIICMSSLLFSEHWWCNTGSHRKWPDIHTCFLSTRITLRWARWEFWADQPAALCLMQTNRVCAGQAGALFFLSEKGMKNSRACHNTPQWSIISSQHCHKVNTSSAVALCFLTCLAVRSAVAHSLVFLLHTLLQKCLTFYLEFTFPRAGLSVVLQRNHSLLWGQVLFITAACVWHSYRRCALPL